jgi:hypothetical protein
MMMMIWIITVAKLFTEVNVVDSSIDATSRAITLIDQYSSTQPIIFDINSNTNNKFPAV